MVDGTINRVIGIASKEKCDEINNQYGTDYKSTVEQFEELVDTVYDEMSSIGKKNGMYVGDSFRIKVEIEYLPEDK